MNLRQWQKQQADNANREMAQRFARGCEVCGREAACVPIRNGKLTVLCADHYWASQEAPAEVEAGTALGALVEGRVA